MVGALLVMVASVVSATEGGAKKDPALRIQIGEPMPALELEDVRGAPEGQHFTPEALKGKVVILEFWGPFCVPCIKAFPHVNKLVKTLRIGPSDRGSLARPGPL